MRSIDWVVVVVCACGPTSRNGVDGSSNGGDGGQTGCGGLQNCYSVYAHSDHVLYVVDLQAKTLSTVGPFNAPGNDTMTDLAVSPGGTIYTVSKTALYTANASDGHVTTIGSLSTCGTFAVALTTTPDGKMWTGDYSGALCEIDITASPPRVKPPVTMGSGMALSGDLVGVADGTVFGTAYSLSDSSGQGTQASNVLVKIDLATGAVTQLGASGYPKLFGTSFALGTVIGFTHDGTGHVVQLDPHTGVGTPFATFMDPQTNMPISFAGAGVSSLVPVIF